MSNREAPFTHQCPRCKAVAWGVKTCPRCGATVEPLPTDPAERGRIIAESLAMAEKRQRCG